MGALANVPDPRQRRGQRYPWLLLLTLIGAALASGQRSGRAIGHWVRERREDLAQDLDRVGQAMPSEATLRRALRAVDVGALEERIGAFRPPPDVPTPPPRWQGVAVDGKDVRGVGAHGRIVHLVEAARHEGRVLKETVVVAKSNEITAAPSLLRGLDLRGMVVTVDALLAQRGLARQIRRQRGHYLMVIKADQPEALAAIALLFADPPEGTSAAETVARTTTKGHGRLEWRTVEASSALQGWLDWPEQRQVLRRTCRRVDLQTGELREETTYALTSLAPDQADAATLERLWRGHWTIENRVHHARDVTFGEDQGQAYQGNTPQALAALRNALLNPLRARGWTNIADALRHYGTKAAWALQPIGALPGGL